jgi:hypothetical protein
MPLSGEFPDRGNTYNAPKSPDYWSRYAHAPAKSDVSQIIALGRTGRPGLVAAAACSERMQLIDEQLFPG